MKIEAARERVLMAREARTVLRSRCSQRGNGSLSISLNVPGYPKSTRLFSAFFDNVLEECRRFLRAHRIVIDTEHEVKQLDEAGDFYVVPLQDGRPLTALKALTERFEICHPLGRIIDIDLADCRSQPISSLNLKRCLLCEKAAVVCMREATHTYEELREYLAGKIQLYLADQQKQGVCKRLAALALKAILYEVSLSPKPGLVGRFEPGAHRDMDYLTFLGSTAFIAGYFEELALSGYLCQRVDLRAALPEIRSVGLRMEAAMFSATGGVNTQKGLIFLVGLALFSAAHIIAHDGTFSAARCQEAIAAICANMVQKELASKPTAARTHGADCYQRYGPEYGGVRQEAEAGLPSVFDHGLPELKGALSPGEQVAGASISAALTRTLLRLMTSTTDTNVLYRKDIHTLKTVQSMARRALEAGNAEDAARRYSELIDYCQQEYVSPGGSADLLAVTVFFHFIEVAFSSPAKGEDRI